MMKKIASLMMALAMLPAALHAGNADRAQVVTHQKDLGNCIGPVVITHIDGRTRQLPPLGFELEPGSYTLGGISAPSGGLCISARSSRSSPPPIPPLEAVFEAGKQYFIGFDHSSKDPQEWRLLIWKIQDHEGNLLMDIRKEEAGLED